MLLYFESVLIFNVFLVLCQVQSLILPGFPSYVVSIFLFYSCNFSLIFVKH